MMASAWALVLMFAAGAGPPTEAPPPVPAPSAAMTTVGYYTTASSCRLAISQVRFASQLTPNDPAPIYKQGAFSFACVPVDYPTSFSGASYPAGPRMER